MPLRKERADVTWTKLDAEQAMKHESVSFVKSNPDLCFRRDQRAGSITGASC